jgi:hypothetical protein
MFRSLLKIASLPEPQLQRPFVPNARGRVKGNRNPHKVGVSPT